MFLKKTQTTDLTSDLYKVHLHANEPDYYMKPDFVNIIQKKNLSPFR